MALVASRGVSQVTMKSLPIVCSDQLANAWANYEAHPGNTVPISSQIDLTQGNAASCLQALVKDTTDSTARQLAPNIRAARESLLSAVANYSPQVQQGATTSSTAVVSPISKLMGFSSIAEEFAGVNVSNTSSSMTLSLSTGSLLEDLIQQGVLLPCSELLGVETSCIGKNWYGFARRFTSSITASTSSAITGTANSTVRRTP